MLEQALQFGGVQEADNFKQVRSFVYLEAALIKNNNKVGEINRRARCQQNILPSTANSKK